MEGNPEYSTLNGGIPLMDSTLNGYTSGYSH